MTVLCILQHFPIASPSPFLTGSCSSQSVPYIHPQFFVVKHSSLCLELCLVSAQLTLTFLAVSFKPPFLCEALPIQHWSRGLPYTKAYCTYPIIISLIDLYYNSFLFICSHSLMLTSFAWLSMISLWFRIFKQVSIIG